jgi:hypothetical protein
MRPPGLPFLFALALTLAGPPLVCGVPLLVLLYAGGEPFTVTARVVAPRPAAPLGRSWQRRGLVHHCTSRATVPPKDGPACVSQQK